MSEPYLCFHELKPQKQEHKNPSQQTNNINSIVFACQRGEDKWQVHSGLSVVLNTTCMLENGERLPPMCLEHGFSRTSSRPLPETGLCVRLSLDYVQLEVSEGGGGKYKKYVGRHHYRNVGLSVLSLPPLLTFSKHSFCSK